MVGKKPWSQKDWQGGERPGQKWQLWHGAWQSPRPKPQRPQYDQVAVPWQKDKHQQSSWWNPEDEAKLRREIPRALSTARKADLKVRKLKIVA